MMCQGDPPAAITQLCGWVSNQQQEFQVCVERMWATKELLTFFDTINQMRRVLREMARTARTKFNPYVRLSPHVAWECFSFLTRSEFVRCFQVCSGWWQQANVPLLQRYFSRTFPILVKVRVVPYH